MRGRWTGLNHVGNHVGIVLAIATGAVAHLAFLHPAQAQDLNQQTQWTITAPLPVTPAAGVLASPVVVEIPQPNRIRNVCSPNSSPSSEQKKVVADKFASMSPDQKRDFLKRLHITAELSEVDVNKVLDQHPKEACAELASIPLPGGSLKYITGQPTQVRVSLSLSPTYETNVLKAGNNSSPGASAGFGSSALFTTAGARPLDLFGISFAEGSSRYTPFPSQSADVINSFIAYSAFLNAYGYSVDPKTHQVSSVDYVDPNKPGNVPDQGLATIDTLVFGVQNQTGYAPTFHNEKSDFFTPQFTLSRQNINLDDATHMDCSFKLDAFCHFANLSLTVGQSFSDVTTQQNFNVAGAGSVGWRIDSAWTVSLQGMATGKEYENLVGGRQDLLLQGGPVLSYSSTPVTISTTEKMSVSFSLPITYYRNYSTLAPAAWSGLVIQPTLSVAFTYTKS